MKTLLGSLVLITVLAIIPVEARAQGQDKALSAPDVVQPVQPDTPPPAAAPPPPPAGRPSPPAQPVQPSLQKPTATGQWVHTAQYGWVWMPYGDTFTHVPSDGGTPSMYVYYPEAGWCWVVAPWLWGWGPLPYFGLFGPRYYSWYGVGCGHWYGFAGPYAHWGWSGRAYWHGGRWNGGTRFYGGRGSYGGQGRGGFSGGGGRSRGLRPAWHR